MIKGLARAHLTLSQLSCMQTSSACNQRAPQGSMEEFHGATDKGTAKARRCARQRGLTLLPEASPFSQKPSVEFPVNQAKVVFPPEPVVLGLSNQSQQGEKAPTTSKNQEHPHEGVTPFSTSFLFRPGRALPPNTSQKLLPTFAEGSLLASGTFVNETNMTVLCQFRDSSSSQTPTIRQLAGLSFLLLRAARASPPQSSIQNSVNNPVVALRKERMLQV